MRAKAFLDLPQRELLWETISYRDDLVYAIKALTQFIPPGPERELAKCAVVAILDGAQK